MVLDLLKVLMNFWLNFNETHKGSNGFLPANGGHPPPPSAAGKMMGGRGSGSGCSRNRTQEFFSAVGSLENTYVTHRQPLLQNGATNKHGQLAKRYHQNSSSHDQCQNQSVKVSTHLSSIKKGLSRRCLQPLRYLFFKSDSLTRIWPWLSLYL